MKKLFNLMKNKKQVILYDKLNMGLINHYSHIIPKSDLSIWLEHGWIEAPHFHDFLYFPRADETMILGKPRTLAEINLEILIGKRIAYCNVYGTYGMGCPNFFGLVLDGTSISPGPPDERDVLVFAAWGADEYTIIDDRVIACDSNYYQKYQPWLQFTETGFRDDLRPMIISSTIINTDVSNRSFIITTIKDNEKHVIEFVQNDPRLPPHPNGSARSNAFNKGGIDSYILFQKEHAVLHIE